MKEIDAIKLVREIRERQYSEIKNKTNKEIIQYFKDKSKLLKKELESVWNLT